MRMVLVVPFLDEEGNLPVLLASLAAQTRLPEQLLLVDDGSRDRSPELATAFAAAHPWAEVRQRPLRDPGRDRLAGGAAISAFEWGVSQLDETWDVVAKVDADLELTPPTLAAIERALQEDPTLGITGAYLSCRNGAGVPVRHRGRADHVDGATKFYRRGCYNAIAPLPILLGWDSIDEVRAHLAGWRTGPVAIPGGDPTHRRPMSSYDGILRGYRRRGECGWSQGEPFLHTLAMGLQRIGDRPRVLAGANYVVGWLLSALRRKPRAEPEVIAAVRSELHARLRSRARRELGQLTRTG
jgi:biofilm PGA synthesis N-glycosyltransferase PgaC